jgi:hypothetical protein
MQRSCQSEPASLPQEATVKTPKHSQNCYRRVTFWIPHKGDCQVGEAIKQG